MGLNQITMQPGDISESSFCAASCCCDRLMLTPVGVLLAVLMPEAVTQLVMPVGADRPRQVIGFRDQMQHLGAEMMWPSKTIERCSPNTLELLSFAHYTATKGIALRDAVDLETDVTLGSESAAAHKRKLQEAAMKRSSKLCV